MTEIGYLTPGVGPEYCKNSVSASAITQPAPTPAHQLLATHSAN